jgi:ABC-type transport system involved in multi-copper enzyme maturation permease subunit
MGLFVAGIGVAAVVKVENAATATFLLNLGMTLAFGLGKLATLLAASRQIPEDTENGTVYPLLARPVGRGEYVAGKTLGAFLSGIAALAALFLLAWGSVMLLVPQAHIEGFSAGMLGQTLALQAASLAAIAAIAVLLSLLVPRMLGIVIVVALVMGGGAAAGIVRAHAAGGAVDAAVAWLTSYVPDFGLLDLTTAYTDGAPALGMASFAGRLVYAAAYTLPPLFAAIWIFRRRQL